MARSHGSSDWLLKMIRSDEIDNFLETIPGVKTLPNMRAPSKDDSTERELKTYLKEYGFDSKKTANIAEWWPKSGPKWDYICQAKINGSDGIILVEAKAHRSESGGKCSAKSIDSRNRIKSALQATHAALAPWQTYNEEAWFTKYYQIANRMSLSQTPWNLIRGMATPKQPVSHQATPSIDQSPVSVNRARFIFSEGICL